MQLFEHPAYEGGAGGVKAYQRSGMHSNSAFVKTPEGPVESIARPHSPGNRTPPCPPFVRGGTLSLRSIGFRHPRIISIFNLLLAMVIPSSMPIVLAQDAGTLREFTGARTRIVWIQDHSNTSGDTLAVGQRLKLIGFDSEDDMGERAILGELRNYAKPLLSPDGQRVVFSDQQTQKFYVVNWDGSGKKLLGEGLAVDVWRGPQDATDWIYFAKRVGKPENVTYRNLRRLKLSDPKVTEKVWDQTDVGCDNFQLAADGTRAAGEFPWPNGGIVDLARKKWQKLDEGCWASIAPDNSGVSWVFDGPHRHLQFHRPDQTAGWKVNINSAPNIQGAEVFHPRWSNHVRYFAMTGPYNIKGAINMISGGGPQVEVYLGRFAPDFQSVEAWWPVTDNARGDFYPDVWISGGEQTIVELPGLKNESPAPTAATWPAETDGLMFAWNNASQTNQIPETPGHPGRPCEIALHGRAFPGRFHDLCFQGGTGRLQDLDAPLLAACRAKRELTLTLLVTASSLKANRAAFCQVGTDTAPHLRLLQDSSRLRWQVGTMQGELEKPIWSIESAVQLTVVVTSQSVKIYADGKPVLSTSVEAKFADWKSAEISLGSQLWRGHIEALAIYSRRLTPAEVARQSTLTRQRLTLRKPIARYRVLATCRERSTVPDPKQILPYRRALAVHEFEVQKIEESEFKSSPAAELKVGERLLVAQWVILDGETLKESSRPRVGETVELTIEPVDGHPELKSERQIQDVEALDLPLYYNVGHPP